MKKQGNYYCIDCHYFTCNKKDYNKHLLTLKHKNNTNMVILNKKSQKSQKPNNDKKQPNSIDFSLCQEPTEKTFDCKCGKKYKARNSLWYHKKNCSVEDELLEKTEEDNNKIKMIENLLETNIKMMESFVNVINNINTKHDTSTIKNNSKEKQQIIHNHIKHIKHIKNNTVNNINIRFFLNDICKDAMNITDFINTLKIGMADLDKFGKEGFIEGISNVIIKGLNQLEITQRPIHCTDIKRKSLYFKDKDTWNKEETNMDNIKKIIDTVRHKNMMKLPEWQQENPTSKVLSTQKNKEYIKIANKVMGGSSDIEDEQNYTGIIGKVSTAIVIDKNIIIDEIKRLEKEENITISIDTKN